MPGTGVSSRVLVAGMGRDVPALSRPVPGFSNDLSVVLIEYCICSLVYVVQCTAAYYNMTILNHNSLG